MKLLERCSIALRHHPALARADWLWDRVRPLYNTVLTRAGGRGLERTINGSDSVLVLPRYRGLSEVYEPEVWHHLMGQVRPGDIVADVGAFVGLYTIALARRVQPTGKVFAFEPDPTSYAALEEHVALNGLRGQVTLWQAAVGNQDGTVAFAPGKEYESHISRRDDPTLARVRAVRLDTVLSGSRLDILKIDVEGYEEEVLRGAATLLADPHRAPRLLYIEIHPYAWAESGASSESLLSLLAACHYEASFLNGKPIERLERYGEIVAVKKAPLSPPPV